MREAARIAAQINETLPAIKVGALRVFGDWFGRPNDAFLQATSAAVFAGGKGLVVEFDGGATLRVWGPKRGTISWTAFSIQGAERVRWEWFFYGRPQSPDNRYFIEHVRAGRKVTASTNADFAPSTFAPAVTLPAVEILDGWEHLPTGNPGRPRPE